jgi:hypothetical protein
MSDPNAGLPPDRGAKTSTSDPGTGTVLPAKRHASALRPYAGQGRR